ncbi:MAG: alanine dehydrogenase [Candidatus Sumerlaeota bacterium]|nr:alanine dehydrogenase [Candidatus Sumerlaeota bacterium]
MIVGVPREIKADEYRVGLLPVGAHLLREDGHAVLVERDAGLGSGFDNAAYEAAGARIVADAAELYARADMIMKVKEPQANELPMLRAGQVVFTYFHFAASRELTQSCLRAGITAVAYETLQDREGRLPLLTPMSEVAGKMSIQEGAKYLEKPMMGRGILLGGVAGVAPANVLILGGGVVGSNAARVAAGLGANVVIMDISIDRLRYLDDVTPANVTTIYCDPHAVREYARQADLVIGAVLIPGARAPRLVDRELTRQMRPGAVLVDVCIDQGGCAETSRPTTHHEPTFIVDGVVHYCVTNMPGAVGRTSTQALCNATLPYARELAALGPDRFAALDPGRAAAMNMKEGKILNKAVASAFQDA